MTLSSNNSIVDAILGNVKLTKSVLCSVFAFLEAIHEQIEKSDGAFTLQAVLDKVVKANGIASQGNRAPRYLARFGLPTDNVSGDLSGRKTPHARVIMPQLVDCLCSQGFESVDPSQKVEMLNAVSAPFRSLLGLSLGPMRITPAGMSAAAVVEEVLRQAEEQGIASAIAELLVGSKLEICLGKPHGSEVAMQHKWENGHDDPGAQGDYRIDNVAIEVTMVAGPDETHRK